MKSRSRWKAYLRWLKQAPPAGAWQFEEAETYDVVVTKVPVRDLLFALARDSGVNMDVDARVGGVITMSALDQTLAAILERIKQQVNIRVDKVGEALVINRMSLTIKNITLILYL